MFLAIDIGNTHITCGIYYESEWIKILRIESNLNYTHQFNILKQFNVTDVAISSVVPKITPIILKIIKNMFQIDAFEINYKNSGVDLKVDSPKEVGIDRICNSIAARRIIGCPAIIGDIGSATNYDVVDLKGAFIGGAIAPGLEIAAKNLFKKAALLKGALFKIPKNVIGKDTSSNLQSGIMFGAIDVIDGMFKRILTEAGWSNVNNIVTGGFGKLISSHLKTKHTLIPTLTLDGILIIYNNTINS